MSVSHFGAWIIDTDVDAETTLRRMARLCVKAMLDPRVIHAANVIIEPAAARDIGAQIECIHAYLDVAFEFVDNPEGTQTIRPPGWTNNPLAPGMLEDIAARGETQGACDDAAVLAATLGMADSMPARFRAIAFAAYEPGRYTHVIADLWDGVYWREMDITRPPDRAPLTDAEIAKTLVFPVT